MVLRKYKVSSFGETKRLLGEGDDLPESLLFRDKLYVFDENGNRIGRFSLNIDQSLTSFSSAQRMIFVHISNRAFINGKLSESIVTGTVTHKLKTLEEIRYELHYDEVYYSVIRYFVLDAQKFLGQGLVGESANALLMRKLAKKGYEGIICLKTILSNGKRCRSYYVTKLSQQMVNGKEMEVLIVYRNITNHRKYNITLTMALTRTGQLLYLFWSNSKCFLHIDPDFEINPYRFAYGKSGLQYHWNKDMQLHSMYLDKTTQQMMLIKAYEYQNLDLRRLLGDFIEYILVMKPDDVICFAIKFFSTFTKLNKCTSKKNYAPINSVDEDNSFEEYEERKQDFQSWLGEDGYFIGA